MASDAHPDPSTSTSPPAGPSTPALNPALTSSSTTTDPPAPPPPPPGSRKRSQKFKRSRAGCLACRKIKQRCDELKPVCVRCSISGKECTWPEKVIQQAGKELQSDVKPQEPVGGGRGGGGAAGPSTRPTTAAGPSVPTSLLHALAGPSTYHPSISQAASVGVRASSAATVSTTQGTPTLFSDTPPSALPPPVPSPSLHLARLFPSQFEQDLMLHFLREGATITQSSPSHLPILYLDPRELFGSPRGTSIATDALLFSVLAMAAIHQASVPPTLDIHGHPPPPQPGAPFPFFSSTRDRMRSTAAHLSQASHALLSAAISLSSDPSDTLLSTALTLVLGGILGATRDWKVNGDIVRRLVDLRGGPDRLLRETKEAMEKGLKDESALMRVRAMLEYMVFSDICDCIGRGHSPTILNEPFCPWWFDFASMGHGQVILDEATQAASDWETVETTLGVSRGLLELLNRTVHLVSQCLILASPPPLIPTLHPPPPQSSEERLLRAQDVLLELDIWKGESLVGKGLDGLSYSRVHYGNSIYASTIKIMVLIDVLNMSHNSPTVQEEAFHGNQLLLQSVLTNGQVVCLMWPALIFGCLQLSQNQMGRETTLAIIEAMRPKCALDIDAALDLLHHVWARRDAGEENPSWRDHQRESGLLFL